MVDTLIYHQDRIVLPGWTTTPVSGAPKIAGEEWEDRDPLVWAPLSRCWRLGVGVGLAFADGSASSGATTANVRVRPVLALPVTGRPPRLPLDWQGLTAAIVQWLPKIVGVAISAGANVYRVGDPASVNFGLVGTSSTQAGPAGVAAQAAAEDATLVPVRVQTPLPMPQAVGPSLPDISLLAVPTASVPDDERIYDRAETAAVAAGVPVLQDRTDPTKATTSITSGGAGKLLLGRTTSAHASGSPRIAVTRAGNAFGDAMTAWLAASGRMGAALCVHVDADDAADVARWCGDYDGEVEGDEIVGEVPTITVDRDIAWTWDSVDEVTLTTQTDYALRLAPIHSYTPGGALSDTWVPGCDVPDIAVDFPYDQLDHCAGMVPTDQVIVYRPSLYFDPDELYVPEAYVYQRTVAGATPQTETRRRPRTWVYHSGLEARVKAHCGALGSSPRRLGSPTVARFWSLWGDPFPTSVAIQPERELGPLDGGGFAQYEDIGDPVALSQVYEADDETARGYAGSITDPAWGHPALRDLSYRDDSVGDPTLGASYNFVSDLRREPYPWRVARVALPGGLGTGLEGALYDQPTVWPAPTIDASAVSVAVSTVGVETQLVWTGMVAATIPASDYRSEPIAGTTQRGPLWLSIYHPGLRRWLRGARPGSVYWDIEPQGWPYQQDGSAGPLTIRLRNAGPDPVTLHWRLDGVAVVQRQEYDLTGEYPVVVRGTVVVPVT